MSDKIITSRDNALVKRARAVRDGKLREEIFIEGLRLCEEARQALGAEEILDVIYTERIAQDGRGARLLEALRSFGGRMAVASEAVFASVSDTKTAQGLVMLAARPATGRSALASIVQGVPLIVVMHRVNNPSNAGAILRTAEAAGATSAILTEGTTDIFSPKALRGAMGSSLRLPLWTGAGFTEALAWCKESGIRAVCADLRAERAHTEIDWTRPSALVVGSEAAGLTAAEMARADEALRIPMRPPVESLNVAVAAAVVLYEAARQRKAGSGQWAVGSKKQPR
jgi:RNA methyltransferase, TrmH family